MSARNTALRCCGGKYFVDPLSSNERLFDILLQGMEESNRKRPPFLREMANHGWYMSPGFVIPALEATAVGLKNDRSGTEQQLCEFFENRIDSVTQYVKVQYPQRYDLLAEAFWAHRQGKFAVAVPVFLAQAEGICVDTFGEKLYSKKSGRPKLACKFRGLVADTPSYNLVLQMVELFPIAANDSSVKPGQLNRHQIMHGKDLTYGTRLNSCKAISLIDYVSWACKEIKP